MQFGLKFHRSGKTWLISCGDYHPQYHEENPIDWKPLDDASVKLKTLGVEMFPDLLEAMEKSQAETADKIESVCEKFDAFAAKLGIAGKLGIAAKDGQ